MGIDYSALCQRIVDASLEARKQGGRGWKKKRDKGKIMEPMTIREILEAVDGRCWERLRGPGTGWSSRVETDSRTIHPGSLFIPPGGERFDGHAYINAALEGGAAGCFTQRERESYLPGKFYIKVESTTRALRDLALVLQAEVSTSPWWP